MKNCSLRSRHRILRAKGETSRTRARILITQTRVEIFLLKHKNHKLWRGGRTNRYKLYPNQLNRLKRVEKSHRLKSQLIYSEDSEEGMARTTWFSDGNFRFFQVNGKWPRPPPPPPSAFLCSPRAIEKKKLTKTLPAPVTQVRNGKYISTRNKALTFYYYLGRHATLGEKRNVSTQLHERQGNL